LKTLSFFELVQEQIRQVEALMRAQADGHHSELAAALDHLLSAGGKRLRPVVTLLVGRLLGGDTDRLVILASAIEMLHTATLVHDDLIDGALFRRGTPTLNANWSPAATVLTGDFIFAKAAKLAADTNSVEVMHLFAATLSTIVNGEITQLFASRGQADRQDYYRRIYAKTASLFETAATTAAILCLAGPTERDALQTYGREVGMAFQIVDDVLDFTGEQETVGKPLASDLRQGLVTLPALNYLDICPNDADMAAILAGAADDATVKRLVEAIRRSDAIQQALEEARQFAGRGAAALAVLPAGVERQALRDLAEYFIQRQL